MALINVGASFPSNMWAVVRLLLTTGRKADRLAAKRLLTPPTLPAGETDDFDDAVKSLADLGIVTRSDETVELATKAGELSLNDVVGFNRLLRSAALDPRRNEDLAVKPDADGPKDLTRALAWFLTRDPFDEPLDWPLASKLQAGAFPSHLPDPIVNDVRWNRFMYWAPALGFAGRPLLPPAGPVRIVPDCTVAVRETVHSLWHDGQSVNASEAVARIVEELPVLPGGRYSRALGLPAPEGRQSASLSNALLTGEEDGWIKFGRPSDAGNVFLADGRGVASFTIYGRA